MDPKAFVLFCSLAAGDYFSGPRNDPRFREANFIPANKLEFQVGKCLVQGTLYSLSKKHKKTRKIVTIASVIIGTSTVAWNLNQRNKVK